MVGFRVYGMQRKVKLPLEKSKHTSLRKKLNQRRGKYRSVVSNQQLEIYSNSNLSLLKKLFFNPMNNILKGEPQTVVLVNKSKLHHILRDLYTLGMS